MHIVVFDLSDVIIQDNSWIFFQCLNFFIDWVNGWLNYLIIYHKKEAALIRQPLYFQKLIIKK